MPAQKNSLEGKRSFASLHQHFETLTSEVVAKFAMLAGDIVLVIDDAGTIVDVTADPAEFHNFNCMVGSAWVDTVSIETKPKVLDMLESAHKGVTQHWRQVNHTVDDGNVPVRYAVVSMGAGAGFIAFGRDMRDAAGLQQRLLQAQQSLERDYLQMRQLETRYRLLFDQSAEPVIIIDADSYRIREANPAAHRLFGAKAGTMPGGKFTALFTKPAREQLIAFLGSVMVSSNIQPIDAEPVGVGEKVLLSASGFRQRGGHFLLVRLTSANRVAGETSSSMLDVIESMPDAFVLTDAGLSIQVANAAFVELVGATTVDQVRGRPLGEFVGRPGIGLDMIDSQLAKHEIARNVTTVVGATDGFEGEPVELSAVRTDGDHPAHGFVIRPIGRRLRDLPAPNDTPRSVEQLTELVGRMSLKDIVRESTDLIERLCIEAALEYTTNNRASAAEILGLSRQSLYSKLHRYGLGNLVDAAD